MSALVIVILLFVTLFVLSFITKRRFGVLGLALAAGSLLSINWTGTLTPFIEQQGVVIDAPPLSILVQSGLILAPPLLLLFNGPTYGNKSARLFGSLGFALLAMTFLLPSIGGALILEGPGFEVYKVWHNYQSLLIVIGLVLALVDVLLSRHHKVKEDKRKKH